MTIKVQKYGDFLLYEEGNPKKVISPDVFVVRGVPSGVSEAVPKELRRSYKTWEEQDKAPDFVLEITSKTTKKEDQQTKPAIYASLGIQEYFQYDPTGDYLNPRLQGSHLVEGNYQPITQTVLPNGVLCVSSDTISLC